MRWVPKQLTDQQVESSGGRARVFEMLQTPWRLISSDNSLFTSLKLQKRFSTNKEAKGEKWTKGFVGNYFEEGIKKLIPCFTISIERNGDYVEK